MLTTRDETRRTQAIARAQRMANRINEIVFVVFDASDEISPYFPYSVVTHDDGPIDAYHRDDIIAACEPE